MNASPQKHTFRRFGIALVLAGALSISLHAFFDSGFMACTNSEVDVQWNVLGPNDDSKRMSAEFGAVLDEGTTSVNMEVDWDDGTSDSANQNNPFGIFNRSFNHQFAVNGTYHVKLDFESNTNGWTCSKVYTITFPLQ